MENDTDGLQCLECGVILPGGVERCPSCGNEKNLMAARWPPPEDEGMSDAVPGHRMARETRILVGLTLALFCALIFLGSARARTNAFINGSGSDDIMVVSANYTAAGSTKSDVEEVTVDPEPVDVDPLDNINALRLRAQVSEINGDYYAAVDAWKDVLGHDEAGMNDFLSLARSQDYIEDLLGAGETLTRACNRYPDQPEVYLALGALREKQGNMEAARFQYQVGLSYCPDNQPLHVRLAEVDKGLSQEEGTWPPDWLNDPEIPEISIPEPEPEPVVIYEETQPDEEVENREVEPINIFEEPEVISPEGDIIVVEPDNPGPVTLIGIPDEDEVAPVPDDENTPMVSEDTQEDVITEPLEIRDMRVIASDSRVTIEIFTNRAAIFSTSRGIDAPRLFVRIPDAIIPDNSTVARNININVPVVERITLVENSDTNAYVSLVIYLDPAARHSVAAVGQSLQITITRVTDQENEGLDE